MRVLEGVHVDVGSTSLLRRQVRVEVASAPCRTGVVLCATLTERAHAHVRAAPCVVVQAPQPEFQSGEARDGTRRSTPVDEVECDGPSVPPAPPNTLLRVVDTTGLHMSRRLPTCVNTS